MTIIKKFIVTGVIAASFASTANAATALISGVRVTRLTTDSASFTGCLVRLDVDPQATLPNCGANHVVLDCDGTLGTPRSVSSSLFSAAQLALVTQNSMRIRVDDSRISNGFCIATRIDNNTN